ncbi:MAG: hypothetical protein JXQ30_08680 [Spirochaetes bacterium]|nr:hypothetical protein [Spirochaetota bacterium]
MKKKGSIAKNFICVILGVLLFFGLRLIIKNQAAEFKMFVQFLGAFLPYMGIFITIVGGGRAFKNSKWSNTNGQGRE